MKFMKIHVVGVMLLVSFADVQRKNITYASVSHQNTGAAQIMKCVYYVNITK